MVLEVALIDVTDPDAFAAAFLEAREILASTPGCRSVRMTRGIESAERFVLLVEWDDVEAHLKNFRETGRWTPLAGGDRALVRRTAARRALRRRGLSRTPCAALRTTRSSPRPSARLRTAV
jgi:hypothetical protein